MQEFVKKGDSIIFFLQEAEFPRRTSTGFHMCDGESISGIEIIEILRIFAFNRAFFGLMQNKKKYRNLLVSISLPINLKAFVIPLFPMSNKI